MPDWSALRQRARIHHARLRAVLPRENMPLPSAETLLAAAEAETGYQRIAVSKRDPLLAGAQAVLNRDMECIWFAHQSPPPQQRFAQAHEFAHYWLHPYSESCAVDDNPDNLHTASFTAAGQIAEGYSPKQRREDEANVFAAEFLLPAPSLRRAFLDHRWSAVKIAEHVGVSESWVLAQLEEALLLPVPADDSSKDESGAAPKPRKNRMDTSQRAAAEVKRGPVLVDAGPGTGKTHTLVGRAIYLISERGVAPENLLALTFSNKAAEEMRTRLRAAVGDPADLAWIGTFHAFGYEILRRFGQRIGLPLTPRLLDNADAVTLLERHLDRLPLSEYAYLHDPSLPFLDILSCISRAKDEMKTPKDYLHAVRMQRQNARNDKDAIAAVKAEEVGLVYAVYQELLDENRLLDFGDLIMKSVLLLDNFPEVQASLQAQFPFILADEYQDVNRASAQLVKRLAGNGRGLWAVGDLRQAIYRFRGASPANVSAFEHDYPGGRRLRLESNYRSVPPIVSLFAAMASQMRSSEAPGNALTANPSPTPRERGDTPALDSHVAEEGTAAHPQPLSHSAGEGPNAWAGMWQPQRIAQAHAAITVAVAEDEEAQADGLAAQIRGWEAKGVPFREQAILCRTNAQATDLSSTLEARGIPTLHLGDLFGRPEVKDLLAVIALGSEPEGTALTRVARFPEYAVPFEDVQHLWAAALQADKPFPSALELAASLPDLSDAGRAGLTKLWRHVKPLLHRSDPWMLLARYLFQNSRYLRPLLASDRIADQQKLLAIHQLLGFVAALSRKLAAEHDRVTGTDLLNRLRHLILCREDRMARLPAGAEALNGVRLMTVHASKGLEFPVIFLPNLVKGQFPPRGQSAMASPPASLFADGASWPDIDGEEEAGEECLFFVALSRARDHLVLSRPKTWRGKPVPPSPLLAEMEQALSTCKADRQEWLPTGPGPFGESAGLEQNPDAEAQAPAPDATHVGEANGSSHDRPSVSLSALEQYRRCPRQYFYQRVAKLPEKRSEAVYVAFHVCVEQTMEWLKAERLAHRTPSLEEAKEHLAEVWAKSGPDVEKSATARVLREQADLILMNAYYPLVDAPFVAQEMRLTAELPNGNVHLLAENAEQLPDGTLRLVREIKGRGRSDDHTDPRLALIRLAAKQKNGSRPVQIALSYLREGTVREIEESKRYEPARVAKYDSALKGIRENRFPPAPDDRACPRCPFFFLCPI